MEVMSITTNKFKSASGLIGSFGGNCRAVQGDGWMDLKDQEGFTG